MAVNGGESKGRKKNACTLTLSTSVSIKYISFGTQVTLIPFFYGFLSELVEKLLFFSFALLLFLMEVSGRACAWYLYSAAQVALGVSSTLVIYSGFGLSNRYK
jgi:hypothetical protein